MGVFWGIGRGGRYVPEAADGVRQL